jgi:predicted dehydrogenase
MRAVGIRVGVVGLGYWGTKHVRVLRSTTGVVIATPPTSHASLALRAIAAGKHVLIEKPMATTTNAARTLVEAAEAVGVVLMPGHTFEHNAAIHKLRDLVRGGHLARPTRADHRTGRIDWPT